MDSRAHPPAIQARPLPTPIRSVGQDLTAPFTIFIDGAEYSDFPSLDQADSVYAALRAGLRPLIVGVQ